MVKVAKASPPPNDKSVILKDSATLPVRGWAVTESNVFEPILRNGAKCEKTSFEVSALFGVGLEPVIFRVPPEFVNPRFGFVLPT